MNIRRIRGVQVLGVEKAIQKLSRLGEHVDKGVQRGLEQAGLHLQRLSQKVVPVLTGNLKNSAFTRTAKRGRRTRVYVGYTASYAVYVHENLTARHAEGKQAKFLEGPMREHHAELLRIIRRGGRP